jgi:hypothetical protein
MLQESVAGEAIYSTPTGKNPFADIVNAVRDHLNAVETGNNSLWDLGDLLVARVGPRGRNGAHNQSNNLLRQIATQIKQEFGKRARGFGFENLRLHRDTASRFPPGRRLPGLSIHVHFHAPDIETLTAAYEKAEEYDRELTVDFMRDFVRQRNEKDKTQDNPQGIVAAEEFCRWAEQGPGRAHSLISHRDKLTAEDRELSLKALVHLDRTMRLLREGLA